jgi:hypothetical protein
MKNIFISRPTTINDDFESSYNLFHKFLTDNGHNLKRLGGGTYSKVAPLKAVINLIHECCGTIILGYPQYEFVHKAARSKKIQNEFRLVFPTPWNQIEGALAFAFETPVLVIAHDGIEGGVFDHGITGEAVIHLDISKPNWHTTEQFIQPFDEWSKDVMNFEARKIS